MIFLFIWHMHTQEGRINTLDRRAIHTHTYTENEKISEYSQAYTRIAKLPEYMQTRMR